MVRLALSRMIASSDGHAVEEPVAVVRVFLSLCTSALLADMQWKGPGCCCLSGGLCPLAASQAACLSDALVRHTWRGTM